ncbi:phage tail tip lysozyme [Dorea longicatena]|uniref:phage tail tip lysozyme n=1 Tax=Dorea longicatena TaxID=88431 RepID=UPI0022E73ADD|nr:phage tail tip lysozyme [Dorea longicatena]
MDPYESILKQNGFTDEAACAVLGNIEQECNTWNPKQVQIDGGWAAGLFQWENYRLKSGRWKNLDTFAKARGKSWDDASSQLDFMIYEASGGDPFIANNIKKYYSDGFNGFKQETDIDKATTVFEKEYEIAGNAHLQNRITAAHRYYNQFHR